LPDLYKPPADRFVSVDVPAMQFVKVDGKGDPNTAPAYRLAIEWLCAVSYAMKFAAKAAQGKDYVVQPLEGLWWADDPADFVARRKERWGWTMMIMAPEFIDRPLFEAAVEKAKKKLGTPPASLRFERLEEPRYRSCMSAATTTKRLSWQNSTARRCRHGVSPLPALTIRSI
jgi:hypothetical protein